VTALQGFESEQARAMADQVVAPGSPSRHTCEERSHFPSAQE
jgi:hypothetical protein